jgi:hypothetical protein
VVGFCEEESGVMKSKRLEVLAKLLLCKEQLMLRNSRFKVEAAQFDAQVPTPEEFKTWSGAKQMELEAAGDAFARRWGCGLCDAWTATKAPFGGGRYAPPAFVDLSAPGSPILVVALDLRHDADFVFPQLRKWFVAGKRVARESRSSGRGFQRPSPWAEYRYGPVLVAILEEAIRVWDMRKAGKGMTAIARELLPTTPLEVALARCKRRYARARQMIDREGFRDILPFTAREARDAWLLQFMKAKGWRYE